MVGGIDALLNERRLQAAALLAEMHHMPSVAHAMAPRNLPSVKPSHGSKTCSASGCSIVPHAA
jgi:hypothetical protein